MRILSAPARVAETLEAMHLAGVLGAIVPEFGKLYARVLHDLYHIYTVDRHSLVAVRELEKLRSGEFKASQSAADRSRPRARFAAASSSWRCCFTISARATATTITNVGATLTAAVCQRLALDDEETDLVVFLVRKHLLMSQVAQKGDIDDDSTVAGLRAHRRLDRSAQGAAAVDLRRHARGRAQRLQQLARHAAERALHALAQDPGAGRSRGGRSRPPAGAGQVGGRRANRRRRRAGARSSKSSWR